MTLIEFLDALRVEASKHSWRLIPRTGNRGPGPIRCTSSKMIYYECPISCFRGAIASEWIRVAREIGLDQEVARQIVLAADMNVIADSFIRAALLDAVGLVEAGGRMTLIEFLDQLRVVVKKNKFRFTNNHYLLRTGKMCPVSCFRYKRAGKWMEVAREIGLSQALAVRIVSASDMFYAADPLLRTALLDAVGLENVRDKRRNQHA